MALESRTETAWAWIIRSPLLPRYPVIIHFWCRPLASASGTPLLGLLTHGVSHAENVEAYLALTIDDVKAVIQYAAMDLQNISFTIGILEIISVLNMQVVW
jgi:hypothetical protein